MSQVSRVDQPEARRMDFTKQPDTEPIPGYRLIAPLGKGGFGEVWKCVAPGGLAKAIKFVFGNLKGQDQECIQAKQEFAALERIKELRHQYILTMDQIQVIRGELIIVMELADKSLHDLLAECRRQGQCIPREQLLEYLCQAAEALDFMNLRYNLQHLDIKPGNLFLLGDYVKVADFGLVNDFNPAGGGSAELTGITPLYASPEACRGQISRHSDQYSLAIVYQELVSGTLPFNGKNSRQLLMQHCMQAPNLSGLPEADRPIVAKALAKNPAERYPSCLTFLLALVTGQVQPVSHLPVDRLTAVRVISKIHSPGASLTGIELPPVDTISTAADPLRGLPGVPRPLEYPRPEVPAAATPQYRPGNDTVAQAGPTQGPPAHGLVSQPFLAPVGPPPDTHHEGLPPGYQRVRDLGRTALADLWLVQTPTGSRKLAKVVLEFRSQDEATEQAALGQIKRLRHPALMRLDFVQLNQGQLVLGMEYLEDTLAKRFDAYRQQGQPGIPRHELLEYLRQVAAALDDLYQQTGILHLGLNPRNVHLTEDGPLLADFGLLHLLGNSLGQTVGMLNPKYAPPELAENRPERSSDQYSLAVIYQEMLTGTRPFRDRQLRPAMAGSAARIRRQEPPPDLEMLPAPDRPAILRALDRDPRNRFATCTDLIDALDGGTLEAVAPEYEEDVQQLPEPADPQHRPYSQASIHVTSHGFKLQAEPGGPHPALVVNELVETGLAGWQILATGTIRSLYRPGELLTHRCGATCTGGMVQSKLEGFSKDWNAQFLRGTAEQVAYQVTVASGLFSKQYLEVQVRFARPRVQAHRMHEIGIAFRPINLKPDKAQEVLTRVCPKMADAIRQYLAAQVERRQHERVGFNRQVVVTPVFRGGADQPYHVQGKDVSQGGFGFYSTTEFPPEQQILLHVEVFGGTGAVPAKVVRCQSCGGGWFEIGARFLIDS